MTMTQQKQNSNKTPAIRDVVDRSLDRIKELKNYNALKVPDDYSPENAVRSASFIIQDLRNKDKVPVLEACTRESIANAVLDMVVQGLNPMKHQCSFIPRGNKLYMQREYAGTLALAKRFGGVKFVNAEVIYEGDDFRYKIDPQTGLKEIINHEQDMDNIDISKIRGAYAVVHYDQSERPYVEIMSMKMIRSAWQQGDMKGKSKAHENFTDQMVKKTVINRACKLFINSSNDAPIVDGGPRDYNKESTQSEIEENANKQPLSFEDAEVEEKQEPQESEQNEELDAGEDETPEEDTEEQKTQQNGPDF
jgi:recombination protein RecT